jgi:HAD superfamily hydrolase (TIGR01509 family)
MAEVKSLFFDQDGVIIDTERDGHRVAFNRAFQEFGFPVEWDVETYHALLQVGGGKERMKAYLHTHGFGAEVKPSEEDDLIRVMHQRKTEIFIEMLENGSLPLRAGIRRFMHEAVAAGIHISICTTSNERATHVIVTRILSEVPFEFVLAGDVVRHKKPDPEIYYLALQRTGLKPDQAVVVEDSRNGLVAAKGAGLPVVVTTNVYTEAEDLHEAEIIVTCLGDPYGERGVLKKAIKDLDFDGVLHVDALVRYIENAN